MNPRADSNGAAAPTEATLGAWAEVLSAIPTAAALVDVDGAILARNRWIEADVGALLIEPGREQGPRRGIDGTSRWRVRPVRADGDILLATTERYGTGDHLLRRFFASADALYVVYDASGCVVEWNGAWERMLGYSSDEMIGLNSWSLLPAEDKDLRAVIEKDLRERGRSEPSWRMRAADGSYRTIQWSLHFDSTVNRCFGIGRDVSEDARQRDELHRMAYTDDLTGLANRSRTIAELDRHLRDPDKTPAVLFCDLDHFKVVNDSLGHSYGDRLLAALGQRLANLLNGADLMVGRLGGDEFAVVVRDGGRSAALDAAMQVREAVEPEFAVLGRQIRVGVSIGICVADESEPKTAETMFEQADLAVYKAKDVGRGEIVVFGPELQHNVDRRFNIEAELRRGLESGAFEPYFQPIVCTESGAVRGAEALLRWRRNDGRIVTPGEFLDVAIETGLIAPIGRQMISRALTEFSSVGSSALRGRWLTLNVSAREFSREFVSWLLAEVRTSGLGQGQVIVEVTESVALEGVTLYDHLVRLREGGVNVALDDFGTGHSSLAHLRTLPIDVIKIDRSFVADLAHDETTQALTRSLVDLCNALDLDVVFEGIETAAEAAAVVRARGRFAQGYLYGRPMPLENLRQMLDVSVLPTRRPGTSGAASTSLEMWSMTPTVSGGGASTTKHATDLS